MKMKTADILDLIISLMLTLVCIISRIINVDLAILGVYCCFMSWIVLCKREVFLKYFFFMFVTSWMILSVYLIENTDMMVSNLQVTSYRSGALGPLVMVNTWAFFFLIRFDKHFWKKTLSNNQSNMSVGKKDRYKLISIAIVMVVAFFIAEVSNNNYFSSRATNRFFYMAETSALALSYYGYLVFFIPIFTIYAGERKRYGYLVLFLLLYCIFLILIGAKFSPLIQTIYILVITYIVIYKQKLIQKNYKKILFYAAILFLLFGGYSIFQMSHERGGFQAGINQFVNRISNGQGDVWWGIYSKYRGQTHLNELVDELSVFNRGRLTQLEYNFGIYKLMNLIAPSFVLKSYAMQESRFAASTDASFYYYFGFIGCLFLKILLMVGAAIVVNGIINSCKNRRGLEAVLYVWLLTHFIRIYSMSDFYLVVSKSALLSIGLLIVMKLIRKFRLI